MFTTAVWDLGGERKPGTAQIPPILRRVGADIVALAGHTASNTDSIARNCGYRHRAKLLRDGVPIAVLSRFPLSHAEELSTSAGKIARVTVHLKHGTLALRVVDLSPLLADDAAAAVHSELNGLPSGQRAIMIVGSFGHDLATATGGWASLRSELVDLVEISGGHTRGERFRGILGRGVEARGSGTLVRPAGGPTDLVWARVNI